ncbi:hypothetical protein Cgig2_016452 [Carnegiea gigantea]|uniref:NADP-dependent oxidoreductase domain-containing protein n=1 Tax=Carnegiea gigantea TaxID=171969 RepID=A0A9Q1QCE1_9CARY|nr:hypothetical protein Cgig2_016452 [Carnegiea gigantea]
MGRSWWSPAPSAYSRTLKISNNYLLNSSHIVFLLPIGSSFDALNVALESATNWAACEGSLKRLGVDCIDLYCQHRIDINVPIEVTIGELKKLVEEGKIKHIGLSEASATTIRRAHAVHPIIAVQLEELGIGVVAYGPLGRGFLSFGPKVVETLSKDDFRQNLPRFQPENVEQNKRIFEQVSEIAAQKGCTPAQLALAWVHQGEDVCPIAGTTKIENFNQNIRSLSVKLAPEEMAELESLVSAHGDRYGGVLTTWMESETPPLSP